jgi:RNA 2',3'-cyclic 3'-phosphodiesterase
VRAFLAGALPDSLTASLSQRLEPVRVATPQAHWVPAKSLHLTLVFLGEIDAAAVPDLASAFAAVAHRHPPMALRIAGPHTFGPPRRPRVLVAELAGEIEALGALCADAVQAAGERVAVETDRPFRPHVTLARARSAGGDPLLGRCKTALAGSLSGEFVLERLTFFRSETLAGGTTHTPLAAWLLGHQPHRHPA